ncbi:MAG: phosphate ABC transporter substrate-binding/OmpA family protein [Verrucomicrobiota bacterium]
MSNTSSPGPLGKILSLGLILVLIAAGIYVLGKKKHGGGPGGETAGGPAETLPALSATLTAVPPLGPAGTAAFKDNIVELELSEYGGYAGLLLANGGIQPSENSIFFRDHGFKVRITLAEQDDWSGLNSGRFAASATTTDVLAVYGRQLQVTCPLLISYSRGADGIVVRSDIRSLNKLAGRTAIAAQFNESDFFLRCLAQEAGIGVNLLSSLTDAPAADKINLVYAGDAFAAGDLFLHDVKTGAGRLAACVTWAPKTSEVVNASEGKARLLTSNKNLLVVSDILLLNKGFATQNPKIAQGLTAGILEGNRQVRANPQAAFGVLKSAYQWEAAESREELAKIHFANLPENQAYFAGTIDMAGSFGGIYQSAVVAYGKDLLPDPAGYEKFIDPAPLKAAADSGKFAGETIAIAPIKSGITGAVEADPLLSKDIRFQFEPNSSVLVLADAANQASLADIQRLLRISPGSQLRLRGHVDNARYGEFKAKGEAFLRSQAMEAMKLSLDRANEIKRLLSEQFKIDPARIETVGRGWEEPVGSDSAKKRRVEVLWFTLE